MADYPGDLLSFEAVLNRAFLTGSLPSFREHMVDPNAPSAIRVLAKSMHVLAIGWIASIAWLWLATLQQQVATNLVFTYVTALDNANTQVIRIEWSMTPQCPLQRTEMKMASSVLIFSTRKSSASVVRHK